MGARRVAGRGESRRRAAGAGVGTRVVWERAVEAKGGRERLATMRVAIRRRCGATGRSAGSWCRSEKLLVPPGRLWHWIEDERPSKFGLRLEVIDMQRGTAPVVHEGFPPRMSGKANEDDGQFVRGCN